MMEEKKFDELLELDDRIVNQNITKAVNQKIVKRVLLILLLVSVFMCGGIWSVNYITKARSYNPLSEKVENVYEGQELEASLSYELLLKYYLGTFMPGLYYDGYGEIKDLGFGNYEGYGRIGRLFDGKLSNIYLGMSTGSYHSYSITKEGNDLIQPIEEAFLVCPQNTKEECIGFPKYDANDKQKMMEEVLKMPDSSQFEVYVSYQKEIPLMYWNATLLPEYDYQFALTHFSYRSTDHPTYMGFMLHPYYVFEGSESYPDFHDSTTLIDYYQTILTTLSKHEDFVKHTSHSEVYVDAIAKELKNLENNEGSVYGYLAFVSKEEMMEILNDERNASIDIVDVKYSSFER